MKKTIKKSILIILALVMTFAFTACVDPSDDGSDVETITVKMNIIYTDTASAELDGDKAEVKDGAAEGDQAEGEAAAKVPENITDYEMLVENSATVMQILQSFADQEGIKLEMGDASYVTSIDGVAADDSSGWVYEVNDDNSIMEAPTEYIPEDGDSITWKFVKF